MSADTSTPELTIPEPTNLEKLSGLKWNIGFSVLNTFFVQFSFFGSAFVLFLNELSLTKAQIGGLMSLLPFLGLLSLFITPWVAKKGYKRSFVTFWGGRNIATVLLMFTPLVYKFTNPQTTLFFIGFLMVIFGVCRAIGLTALLPWKQEFVPNNVRGKHSARTSIFTNIGGLIAVALAGYIIGSGTGLTRFVILFALATAFGLGAVWMMTHIPGGLPQSVGKVVNQGVRHILATLKDRRFLTYLIAFSFVILATGPLNSFIPLFMREKIGLSESQVVLLQTGTLIGGLISSFAWGWAADRYGSRPVGLIGLLMIGTLPVFWLLMPRMSEISLLFAFGIALLQGAVNLGWVIGSGRLLHVNIVPREERGRYMGMFNAWTGIIGGISQIIGGNLLDLFSGISGNIGPVTIDSYTILFGIGILLPMVAIILIQRMKIDEDVSMGQFAGMFLHGNPFLAVQSVIRYQMARDERQTVSVTEQLGASRSPITVEELLQALNDPRFYVRFEALVSIARHGPDPRLQEAVAEILNGHDPALAVIAAWAMGRIGEDSAVPALREALNAPYRSVQSHAARSLGSLEDLESAPKLLERLTAEQDPGLRVSYASALGKLGYQTAIPEVLSVIETAPDSHTRMEMALSLVRMIGEENEFIQLYRHVQSDPGTTFSQQINSLQKKFESHLDESGQALLIKSISTLARGEIKDGLILLVEVVGMLPIALYPLAQDQIIQASIKGIQEHGAKRMEYPLMLVYILNQVLG